MDLKKHSRYSVPQLRKKAGIVFRRWIRKRDEGKPCVSCGSYNTSDAGHFYSAGHYPALEFNELNTHAQCKRCNMFLSGNLNEYRKGLLYRIGAEELEKLDILAGYYKRHGYKHERLFLIEIVDKYK
jgi:gamma-glutamylcyclotransferase (GGCT)/AIG2-like uncharacterized protein YtfP